MSLAKNLGGTEGVKKNLVEGPNFFNFCSDL